MSTLTKKVKNHINLVACACDVSPSLPKRQGVRRTKL